MAARCTWKLCKEEKEGDNAVIVQFSNGNLKNDQLDFTFFKNVDENNPRKKSRRMLVAESDRLSYVGNNFGSGSLRCNNLCRYYVGVLDKRSMEMEVHRAQLFSMQPVIPGEATAGADADKSETKTYREKVDALIEAFGTNKQKRALSSRRLNQVGSDMLQQAVARAACNVIDQKGIEVLQQEVADTEAQMETALYLPPRNLEAERPEDVYPFSELLSPVEYDALEDPGRKMAQLSPEDVQKLREEGSPQTVVRHLETLPAEGESRERQARCVWYLSLLIKLARQRNITRKFGTEDGCPRIILNKIMKTFTAESFNDGRVKNMVSTSMRVKLASHCLALLLHMDQLTANITLLHRDLGLKENRMLEVAKAMGLRMTRQSALGGAEAGASDEHRLAALQLPLAKYDRLLQNRKRKKMR